MWSTFYLITLPLNSANLFHAFALAFAWFVLLCNVLPYLPFRGRTVDGGMNASNPLEGRLDIDVCIFVGDI